MSVKEDEVNADIEKQEEEQEQIDNNKEMFNIQTSMNLKKYEV